MLQLGSSSFEVDGVTVLSDHADTDQWWYLATRVALDKRPDGSPAFSLLKWKPAAVEAGVKGGGFLMFQTIVTLPAATRSKITGRISSLSPGGDPCAGDGGYQKIAIGRKRRRGSVIGFAQ